jgi:hypothetical protein
MKASNLRRAAVMVQQHMHRTFMELGYALFAPVFYFSLVLNAAEIFERTKYEESVNLYTRKHLTV